MPKHQDFQKIFNRFVKQYGSDKGESLYFEWLNKKGYDDTKPFPGKSEKKELKCIVRGLEIKEIEGSFHIEGLIATTHIDSLDLQEGIDIPDMILKETLEDLAMQMNNVQGARVMGVHHSEGRSINPQHYGEADVINNPAKVIELTDGHYGLYVDTKLDSNKPETIEIANDFKTGELDSFSITYDTDGFRTTDFELVDNKLVRVLLPGTKMYGYTGANNPVNKNAIATQYGFKEFKELVMENREVKKEGKKRIMEEDKKTPETTPETTPAVTPEAAPVEKTPEAIDESEKKELEEFRKQAKFTEEKEFTEKVAKNVSEKVLKELEVKEKVLKEAAAPTGNTELSLEVKEFKEVIENPSNVEVKEQFRRAGAMLVKAGIDWDEAVTSRVQKREFKNFGTNGAKLEFKGLGLTTNQNTDTDYLQSTAELQDVYDPVIYNALNQETVTWNLLAKDDKSNSGNNQCQFVLKIAANQSATFYNGNAVTTGNVTRLKYQTKFKKAQVGVSVDGDIIAAARGGPVSDVFAQEVMDSTDDLLSVINLALFAEVGLETVAAIIGFEYITDSAGNTTLYNLTRSAANKLAPDSATDTYIDGSSAIISMGNLRKAKRQAIKEGAKKRNLVYITNEVQGDLLRSKFDDARRMITSRDTDFGFSTDLFVDGIPVFEDKDCNTDDWFLVDLETHRVGIWIPPTIEKLSKGSDSEDAFIKTYFAIYNRAPRRMVQIYGNAIS